MSFAFKDQGPLPDHPEGWPDSKSSVIRFEDGPPPGTIEAKDFDGLPRRAYPLPSERKRFPGDVATEMPRPFDEVMPPVAPKAVQVQIIKKGK